MSSSSSQLYNRLLNDDDDTSSDEYEEEMAVTSAMSFVVKGLFEETENTTNPIRKRDDDNAICQNYIPGQVEEEITQATFEERVANDACTDEMKDRKTSDDEERENALSYTFISFHFQSSTNNSSSSSSSSLFPSFM
ncbi:hypothetical protein QVD17_00235 [Tagetes erecta]|uniref:Uncharacterized protein n=1 Tax=Tagetes erecta TaxID=13708 RepID=A0AAD8P714_TARER|nr:hypothetical protein QVD17_00235 [Tagetes erecta]